MFLASMPDDMAVTEPGIGIRLRTGHKEMDTHTAWEVVLEMWVWFPARGQGSIGSLALHGNPGYLGNFLNRSELQVCKETCHLVAPWVTSSKGQLVIHCRTGQPVVWSLLDAECQQLSKLGQDRD